MTMQYDLNRINTLTASDLEFIRQQGEDARRALSDAVTGLLSTPEGRPHLMQYEIIQRTAWSGRPAMSRLQPGCLR